MDCRTFHKLHVGYVDDLLPATQMEAMHEHRRRCPGCARHDAIERRALMLVRSLPRIEPSADFGVRLNARIRSAGPATASAPGLRPSRAAIAAAGLAALLVIGVVATSLDRSRPMPTPVHVPVVAVIPEPPPAPDLARDALVASVTTGMPMLPMALLVDQAPVHFANAEFRLTSFSR